MKIDYRRESYLYKIGEESTMDKTRVCRYSIMLSGYYIVNELPILKKKYEDDDQLSEFLNNLHTIALERIEAVIKKLDPNEEYEKWMREKAAYSFRITVSEKMAERIEEMKEANGKSKNELWGVIRKG